MSRQLLKLKCCSFSVASSSIGPLRNCCSNSARVTTGFAVEVSSRCDHRDLKNSYTFPFLKAVLPKLVFLSNNRRAFSSFQLPPVIYNPKEDGSYPLSKAPSTPTTNRRHDHPVSQKLIAARTTEEVVKVLEEEADAMDVITLSVAVDVLFDALKNEPGLTMKQKHQLLTTVGVQKLCKVLRRFGPRTDPGDIINGVKLLSFLSAPGNHQTLQILLKLLTKHANNLDLQQIVYMQFLMDKMESVCKSPLSKALEFALPVVFESQLFSQLDKSNPYGLCDFLRYATRHKLSEKAVNFLVETALGLTDRIPTKNSMLLLWSMCDIAVDNPSHELLVSWAFKKVTESIDDFSISDINTLAGKALKKYSFHKVSYFYNEDFLNAYCHRFTAQDVPENQTLWAIKTISVFRHVNIDLVDRVGDIIARNPSHILNDNVLFVGLIRALANLNYRPEKWASFSSLILDHPLLTIPKNLRWHEVMLAEDLMELDLFPENLIRHLYSEDGISTLEEFQERHHPINLLLLYNAVKILYPEYNGPFPPISMVENWKERARALNANRPYPLTSALQTGLGGDSYVINGLYHEGIHIDHGIVMRKGGYPVAVNSQIDSQSDCLSSIPKPAESVIILVKVYPKDLYANNTRRLRGLAALELNILEKLGHPIVVVDLEKWEELMDNEKIPFLMQRMREKMEHFQWNKNWGDVIPP